MRTEKLPAINSQDEPNVVTITNPKLPSGEVDEQGNPKLGYKFEIPGEDFEYSQFENLSEFVTDAGGEDRALKLINNYKRDTALFLGKTKIRTTVTGSASDILKAGLQACKNHSFLMEDVISAKDAKDALTMIGGKLKDMSPEDVKAELARVLGITL